MVTDGPEVEIGRPVLGQGDWPMRCSAFESVCGDELDGEWRPLGLANTPNSSVYSRVWYRLSSCQMLKLPVDGCSGRVQRSKVAHVVRSHSDARTQQMLQNPLLQSCGDGERIVRYVPSGSAYIYVAAPPRAVGIESELASWNNLSIPCVFGV